MLRNMNSLIGYTVLATDGTMGRVDDVLFDDVSWSTAYLVVNTGGAFNGRRVLLPPTALGRPESDGRVFPVAYSMRQILESPGADLDTPVSLQREKHWYAHNRPLHWIFSREHLTYPLPENTSGESDPHLLSVREVIRYNVRTIDGRIGVLEDLVADDATWGVRYMIIDSGERSPEQKFLVSLLLVKRIAWIDQVVYMDLTTETIRRGSTYNSTDSRNPEAPALRLVWLTERTHAHEAS